MIRFLRICSYPKYYWRSVQYSANRFCFTKTDDLVLSSSKTVPEESDDSVERTTPLQLRKTDVYKKNSRTANSAKIIELIEALPVNPRDITMDNMLNFYSSITGNYLITPAVIRHPKFDLVRDVTEAYLLQFNMKELRGILIAILPCKALMDDKLSQMIVNALIKRANDIPFKQILFTSFILHKCYRVTELNKEYSSLRLTLQRQFLMKIEDEINDLNDFNMLMQIVSFCINNAEVLSEKIANLMTTSLLIIDDDKFTLNDVISCFHLLASFGKLNEHVKKLLDRMINLWCQLDVTASEVVKLLGILSKCRHTFDKEQFNESKFIRHCVNVVTSQSDRKLLFSLQKYFNRVDFTSSELIECLSKFSDFTVFHYIIFCKACAKANYKPANWDTKIRPTLETFKFDIYLDRRFQFNCAEFVFDLDKLGYCDTRMIHKILRSRWYTENNVEKLKEILNRYDANDSSPHKESDIESLESDDEITEANREIGDESPLFKDLTHMFGANKIWSSVRIARKLKIPYVLKMDLLTGEFLPITKDPFSPRHIDNDELLIGIVLVPNNVRWPDQNKIKYAKIQVYRIERNDGIVAIILDENKWCGLKAYEKALVFYTKIVKTLDIHRRNKLKQLATDF